MYVSKTVIIQHAKHLMLMSNKKAISLPSYILYSLKTSQRLSTFSYAHIYIHSTLISASHDDLQTASQGTQNHLNMINLWANR